MAQLIKPQIQWTEDKKRLLEQEYPLGNKKALAVKLGIKYSTLKDAARRFKVKSLKDVYSYKLKPLYEDTPLAYYWMGFIMADGNFTPKVFELRVSLSIKDENHLQKLADLLGKKLKYYKNKDFFGITRDYCLVTCADQIFGTKILKKFGLNPNLPKTYHPPNNLKFDNEKFFFAFLIGMMDGDGTFSKDKNGRCDFIKIELYHTWEKTLNLIKNRLSDNGIKNVSVGVNKRGFASFKLYKQQNLKFLKKFAQNHSLPILERKWNSIDENRILKRTTPDNQLNEKLLNV